ncbi:hypothetical protein HDV01_006072 [Terramyces sp. JEL0728]|nr:hypothetical protein HDV01_006072 [Terramyces sp. JEL0728]
MLSLLIAPALALVKTANSLNTLASNSYLPNGYEIYDSSQKHILIMQNDCNLVLYSSGAATWASGTYHGAHDGQHKCDGATAAMQSDGNFVVYDGNNHALWATGTFGANFYAVMQDDGNLVIYNPATEAAVWASGTNGRLQPQT